VDAARLEPAPRLEPNAGGGARGEPPLPLVITLIVATLIPLLLPDELLPGPRWLFPVFICVLMTAMLLLDPGRIDNRARHLRWLRIAIALVLAGITTYATIALADALVKGSAAITNSAGELLRTGGLVWAALLITFSFVYWELDCGGPAERAHAERHLPDMAFPQDLNPDITPTGWQPTFVDYLYLGLTNNLAFSPTDVMPLSHWAKLTMGVQSIASLLIIGLVIARAVNIFG
jgi:uncharacterized membrane protein